MNDVLPGYFEQLEATQSASAEPRPAGSETAASEAGYASAENRLFGDQNPSYTVKHERPEHRIIIFLKAQGHSNVEIATLTGFTTVMVGYVLKQPWARMRLIHEIEQSGRDGVHELLKGAVNDCVLTLIDIAGDQEAKRSDRIAASNSVLDRYLGKPTVRVESTNTNVTATMSDVKKMQDELATVEAELQRVTGGARN